MKVIKVTTPPQHHHYHLFRHNINTCDNHSVKQRFVLLIVLAFVMVSMSTYQSKHSQFIRNAAWRVKKWNKLVPFYMYRKTSRMEQHNRYSRDQWTNGLHRILFDLRTVTHWTMSCSNNSTKKREHITYSITN